MLSVYIGYLWLDYVGWINEYSLNFRGRGIIIKNCEKKFIILFWLRNLKIG